VNTNRYTGESGGLSFIDKWLSELIFHVYETGFQVQEKRRWFYVTSISHPLPSPGTRSGSYLRTMVYGAWKPSFRYSYARHTLCNVYYLRELKACGTSVNMVGQIHEGSAYRHKTRNGTSGKSFGRRMSPSTGNVV
jgi:hypothetical protein